MAAATSPPFAAYTPPPSSPHGRDTDGRGDWDFSASVDGNNDPPPAAFRERSNNAIPHRSHIPPKPDSDAKFVGSEPTTIYPQVNGHQLPVRNDPHGPPLQNGHNLDGELLVAPPRPFLQRQDSTISSTGGDSLFDLYGGRMSTASGVSVDSYAQIGDHQVPGTFPNTNGTHAEYVHSDGEDGEDSKWIHRDKLNRHSDVEPAESKWIHRDKLARIEGREIEDYLYDTENSRWIHKDKLEQIEGQEAEDYLYDRENSRWIHKDRLEQIENQELLHAVTGRGENQQQRVSSPSQGDEEALYDGSQMYSIDPRSSAEQSSDMTPTGRGPASPLKQFRRNPSYSRIPLSTSSPMPVPREFLERNTPLPRPAASPNSSDDGRPNTAIPVRKRAHSAGSAMLLDDREKFQAVTATPTPGSIRNPKNASRNSTKNGRTSTSSRNTSLSTKQRTRSNPQLYRPSTSASHANSVSTPGSGSKAPEGPPPWAISYKPDPSLPPDQQIIPTVARKMQQDQWERDGVYASVYDRELRPLKVHDHDDLEKEKRETIEANEWPLKTASNVPSEATEAVERKESLQEPSTSMQDSKPESRQGGGYSAMPKISGQQALSDVPERPLPQVTQLPDDEEEKPKKKSFCCCVVM